MEILTEQTSASGNGCIGCQRFDRDIMLSIGSAEHEIMDIFLTKKQAKRVIAQLKTKLKQNKGEIK